MKNTGRPLPEGSWFQRFTSNYLDVPNTPRYPFGHGLSYVDFEYGEITLSDSVVSGPDQQITATIPVTNRGGRDAKEVVQLYLHDRFASTTRPNMELKGFQKVLIPAGETIEVNFTITPELLKFYKYDPESDFTRIIQTWESGDFDLMIGTSAAEYKMTKFTWKK
jgi:beta-glucosidase